VEWLPAPLSQRGWSVILFQVQLLGTGYLTEDLHQPPHSLRGEVFTDNFQVPKSAKTHLFSQVSPPAYPLASGWLFAIP
jgi:hypothetical protein